MNIFEEHYRNLSEQSDFFINERLIFQGKKGPDTPEPKAPEAPAGKPEAGEGQPEEPIDNEHFNVHRDKYLDHIKALKGAKEQHHIEAHIKGFDEEFAKIKTEYRDAVTRLEESRKVKNPKKEAAIIVKEPVRILIEDVIKSIKEHKGKVPVKKPAAEQPEGEKKPEKLTGDIKMKEAAKKFLKDYPLIKFDENEIGDWKAENKDQILNKILNKLPDNILKKMGEKKPKLSPEDQKIIDETVDTVFGEMTGLDKIQKPDPDEIKIINKFQVKMEGKDPQDFKKVFGEGLARILSMTLEVKTNDKKELLLTTEGKTVIVKDAKELAKFLPPDVEVDYMKILEGKEDVDPEKFKEKNKKQADFMEKLSKLKKAPPLTKDQKNQVLDLLGIKDENDRDIVRFSLDKLNLTPEQREKLGKKGEKLALSPAQKKVIRDAIPARIGEYNNKEGDRIDDFLTGLRKKATKSPEKEQLQAIEDLFENGEDSPMTKYLSMKYDIATNADGDLGFRDGKGNVFKVETVAGLSKVLPEASMDIINKILDESDEKKIEEYSKEFQLEGEKQLGGLQAMKVLGEIMRDPSSIKGFRGMEIGDIISTLAKLWALFQEAMKTGDFDSLADGLKDFQEGRNPMKHIEECTEIYEAGVAKIEDTGDLIDLYNNSNSPKADALFREKQGEGQPDIPAAYRIKLKHVIKARLENDLGVEITDMKKVTASKTEITCTKGKDTFHIKLRRDGGRTLATMEKVMTAKEDGHEYNEALVPPIEDTEVENTTTGENSLAYVLFQRGAGTAGGEKAKEEVEKPLPNMGVKKDYFTPGPNGKIILNDKAQAGNILQIFEDGVNSATIKLAKARQGIAPNTTITVNKSNGFKINEGPGTGQRLQIFKGDVIMDAKSAPAKPAEPPAAPAPPAPPKAVAPKAGAPAKPAAPPEPFTGDLDEELK